MTDKGNFLVNLEAKGLFGFFSPEGEFLRKADEKEWAWAQDRMEKMDRKDCPYFDLKSLPKTNEQLIEEINSRNVRPTFADLLKK